MSIKPNDLVIVTAGKPLWRSLSSDEVVAWHLSAEAKQKMPDGSPRTPPDGKLHSSNGTTRYRVVLIDRISMVFGQKRSGCAVIIPHKGPKFFCYMADLEKVNLEVPVPREEVDDPNLELMESIAADSEPLLIGKYEDDGFGQIDLVPYTTEELAAMELARRERDSKRLALAMLEFGALNLEIRQRVGDIGKKFGLRENWVGTIQLRIQEEEK